MVEILQATTPTHYDAVEKLVREYIEWDADQTSKLGLDPQVFIDFYYGGEPESLPGKFAPPMGCLLLATLNGQPAGCIGFRQLTEEVCELKRMYVRPTCRGNGIGKKLAIELIRQARKRGYKSIKLETARFMSEAHQLYQSLGFVFCPPYYEMPESLRETSFFMELQLDESGMTANER